MKKKRDEYKDIKNIKEDILETYIKEELNNPDNRDYVYFLAGLAVSQEIQDVYDRGSIDELNVSVASMKMLEDLLGLNHTD